ncbi:MAG: beta-ketoacyl-[acyl-carrier-protein] synthase family protein [Flavobacteriales bacterium]
MMERVPPAIAITGIGAVSALGNGIAAQLEALQKGRSAIATPRIHDLGFPELVFGEVPLADEELKAEVKLAGADGNPSRTVLLALAAAQQAMASIGLKKSNRITLISASTVGGMDRTERAYRYRGTDLPQLATAARGHEVSDHARHLAQRFGASQAATISTACSSSANAIMLGAQLLKTGRANVVLAGGADALCGFTIAGFRALSAMDAKACRPFSADRAGMNLGEGAAYLVLERLEDAKASGRKPLAIVAGYANANDAFHQTATSPEGIGPQKAMEGALKVGGLSAAQIDHINAHGTATENNDLTELVAMERLFGKVPPFTSTKSLTGHTLAAAGALEAVFSVLSMLHGFVPATARAGAMIDGCRSVPVKTSTQMPVRTVLSNSFGFGGNGTSLLFRAA